MDVFVVYQCGLRSVDKLCDCIFLSFISGVAAAIPDFFTAVCKWWQRKYAVRKKDVPRGTSFFLEFCRRRLHDDRAPVVFVFGAAVLDVLQKRIELQRNLAYFVAVGVGLLRVHVVNAADRRDDSCRTASAALLESREFVHRNMTLLDLQTPGLEPIDGGSC